MFCASTTKEQILAHLKQNGSMTIMELANEIKITEMAVRRHIQTLEREKLVRSDVKKQTMGRPSKVYQLAENGEDYFPKKYKEFSIELLNGLKEAGQEQLLKDILQKRKLWLLEKYKHDLKYERLNDRVARLKEIQDLDGYMPQIDYEQGETHFKELNCPYIDIAKEFPQICQTEIEFIMEFLGLQSITVEKSMADGHSCCHYIIPSNK
nr:winged helix-turn-helix transcriptional regulator [uncultured Bacillus sp.]